jgi:dTDP-4-dehydrorhamnose 3,5-epimerase
MLFREAELLGAFVIDLEPHRDERGFFARMFCEREFEQQGIITRYPQCNLSRNSRAGTLRGMHYNAAPHSEAKLVRCVSGAIYDVIVDLRPSSPTRFRWIGVELTAEDGSALFVPQGFGHGFITLADATDVFYHMSDFHHGESARGFRYDDPRFSIRWPRVPAVISDRDRTYPDFDPEHFDG